MKISVIIFVTIAVLVADFPDIIKKERDKKAKREIVTFLTLYILMTGLILLYIFLEQ